jgi:chemotaxis protein MotB
MSRKARHSHVSHERWLISYADFITLLFAFFVVMFASSRQDHKKTQEAEVSIRTAFRSMGIFPSTSKRSSLSNVVTVFPQALPTAQDVEAMAIVMRNLKSLKHQMERVLAHEIANGTVTVTLGRTGLLISLRDAGFFRSGSAVPIASSLPALTAIGSAVAPTPYDVRIEGHTDNVPIHDAQYADNWELSTARATALTRLFIERDHILPGRLSAAGYAQYHPVASNLTSEGRSRNRRVDIIVLPTRQPSVEMEASSAGQKSATSPHAVKQGRP